MSKPDEITAKALATPLGRAFRRLFDDETFAEKVIESTDEIAAEYDLDADDLAALVSDAHALEGEVTGFAQRGLQLGNPLGFSSGLLSPGRLGIPTTSAWQCLTMT